MGISLDKINQTAPQLINLAKKAQISLKKTGLAEHQAQVALCLDISASMKILYEKKMIQVLAERLLALACSLDDNGRIQIFLFGEKGYHAGDINLANFQFFTENLLQKYPLEQQTNYSVAIEKVIEHYFATIPTKTNSSLNFFAKLLQWQPKYQTVQAPLPVYVMFLTDGEASDNMEAIQSLTKASHAPIFWKFMAIGNKQFEFLETLDDLQGRYIDNADFFSVPTPLSYSEEELYDKLMIEYLSWLKLAKEKQLLIG